MPLPRMTRHAMERLAMMGRKERAFHPLPPLTLEDLVPPDHFYCHLFQHAGQCPKPPSPCFRLTAYDPGFGKCRYSRVTGTISVPS